MCENFGTKHEKGDSRTPEGLFSVEGIYDSTDWLFTDDDGVTSKKKDSSDLGSYDFAYPALRRSEFMARARHGASERGQVTAA